MTSWYLHRAATYMYITVRYLLISAGYLQTTVWAPCSLNNLQKSVKCTMKQVKINSCITNMITDSRNMLLFCLDEVTNSLFWHIGTVPTHTFHQSKMQQNTDCLSDIMSRRVYELKQSKQSNVTLKIISWYCMRGKLRLFDVYVCNVYRIKVIECFACIVHETVDNSNTCLSTNTALGIL